MTPNPSRSRSGPADATELETLRRLGRIDLIAEIVGDALKQGLRRSRQIGFSVEFSDYKAYTPGDDLRFLDWRVFARTDRLLLRKYEAETCFESLLLLDASRSMAWRWKDEISKLEYAVHLFAAMAWVHVDHQDLIGLTAHDGQSLRHVPPRSSRSQLWRIYEVLTDLEPRASATFAPLVEAASVTKKHRGQIVLCSDLEEEEDSIEESLEALASRQDDVVILHLLDRAEIELPFGAVTHFEDSETGERLDVDLPYLRVAHRAAVEELRRRWETRCDRWGIRYLAVDTSMDYVDVLMRIATTRSR